MTGRGAKGMVKEISCTHELRGGSLLLIILTAIVTGCCPTTSLHPLSDPQNPQRDDRLLGVWYTEKEGEEVYLHIGVQDDRFTAVHVIEHKKGGDIHADEPLVTFPTVMEGTWYLNVRYDVSEKEGDGESIEYIFALYEFSDDNTKLSLYSWDERFIEESILKGQLQGQIIEKDVPADSSGQIRINKTRCVKITDSSENIIKFIVSSGPKRIFNEFIGTFERVEMKGKPKGEGKRPEQAAPKGVTM